MIINRFFVFHELYPGPEIIRDVKQFECILSIYCYNRASKDTPMMSVTSTQFAIGQVVKHRIYDFRGVIVDVDPEFSNTEEWWLAIPEEVRPRKDQPFYHLLAENETTSYEAYVSEQNLLVDDTGEPVNHPQVAEVFGEFLGNSYALPDSYRN